MPFPFPYSRIELIGHLGGSEIFNTGFWVGGAAGDGAAANLYATFVAGQFTGPTADALRALLHVDSGYDTVKIYGYLTPGPAASTVGEAPIAGGVGSAGTLNLDQCSCCVTLRTGLSGKSKRGRMYLPANGIALIEGPWFPAAAVAAAVNGLASFFQALNLHDDPGNGSGQVSVVSSKLGSAAPVTELSSDQRPDIQRRRANREPVGVSATAVV